MRVDSLIGATNVPSLALRQMLDGESPTICCSSLMRTWREWWVEFIAILCSKVEHGAMMVISRLGVQDKKTPDHFIFVRDFSSSEFVDRPWVRRLNSLASIGADKTSRPLSQRL